MPARLKNGVQGAPGGARKGSGKKPDWFRGQCRNLLEKGKLLKFASDVAKGADFEQIINSEGETVKCPAKIKDRLDAVEFLAKYGLSEESSKLINQFVELLLGIVARVVPVKCPHCKAALPVRADMARELEMLPQAEITQTMG